MNVLDAIVAAFSPTAGLRRHQARAQLAMVRSYEGASRGRRTKGWRTTAAGPVTEVAGGRVLLRDRARDLVRNNGYAKRAVDIRVSNEVGTGIRPRANTGNKSLNRKIDAEFSAWADAAGFYPTQALAERTRSESGESLVLLDRTGDGVDSKVPLGLQVLETDLLADGVTDIEGRETIRREGIVFNAKGHRTGYLLWNTNPNDTGVFTRGDYREVPADDVVHLFRQLRPGQIRGVTDLASVMLGLRDWDDYRDAALMLAKLQAVLGVFVTQQGGPAGSTMGQAGQDEKGRLESLEPAMVHYLRGGEDVKFLTPIGGGPFSEYTRAALHLIAAGFGITYHQLTGDLRDANYSSLRAGSLEVRRLIEQDQWLMLIPSLCQPIWKAFITQAVLARVLPMTAMGAPAIWTPPRFEMVDPIKDTQAMIAQVRAGFLTLPDAISEMGFDPETQLAIIKGANEKLDELKLVLDTDPRRITATGAPNDAKQLAALELGGTAGSTSAKP